ncbi:MAG: hypothetical protein HOK81_00580, partial [Rhodospirillaceae bacterium]|nr:hypothetical protein [Rhodospirillaceae bacterium]
EAGGIAEVAEDAAPGAVTVAPWGDEFEAAIAGTAVGPPPNDVRDCLLPVRFALESVLDDWAGLLDSRGCAS